MRQKDLEELLQLLHNLGLNDEGKIALLNYAIKVCLENMEEQKEKR